MESTKKDLAGQQSVLLLGDLNHTPAMPEHALLINAGWADSFVAAGKGDGFTINSDKSTRRIDYVLAQGPVAKHVFESRPLFEGAFRTNPDDPESFALSDHLPQMAVFGQAV